MRSDCRPGSRGTAPGIRLSFGCRTSHIQRERDSNIMISISTTETNWSFYKDPEQQEKKFFKVSALGLEKKRAPLSSLPNSSSHGGRREVREETQSRGPRARAGRWGHRGWKDRKQRPVEFLGFLITFHFCFSGHTQQGFV